MDDPSSQSISNHTNRSAADSKDFSSRDEDSKHTEYDEIHLHRYSSQGFKIGAFQVFLLAFTMNTQDLYTFWNISFYLGFWTYMVATLWSSIAFLFMICCLAEMTSTLPFSGGFILIFISDI